MIFLTVLWLLWDYPEALFTVEFEVWHTPALTQPFAMVSVESFTIYPVQPGGQAGFYKVRARYPWNTNLVSDWNKPWIRQFTFSTTVLTTVAPYPRMTTGQTTVTVQAPGCSFNARLAGNATDGQSNGFRAKTAFRLTAFFSGGACLIQSIVTGISTGIYGSCLLPCLPMNGCWSAIWTAITKTTPPSSIRTIRT